MTLSTRTTPAMGWNSWNAFRCYEIDEATILANADQLVALGLADAGYDTVVVDDGWQAARRSADGALQADPARFPSGIGHLAREIHARGLRFGLYLAPGRKTCAQIWDGYGHCTRGDVVLTPDRALRDEAQTGTMEPPASGPGRIADLGSWRRERQDLDQLVGWGIDLLKYDWCMAERGTDLGDHRAGFALMSELIAAQDREIQYSISEYGLQAPWEWAGEIANSWRTTDDIGASADSVFQIARDTAAHAAATRPGHVNDPDMLHAGNLPSAVLDRTHVLLWSMLAAPLMIGTDLRTVRAGDPLVAALTDPVALALDQDLEVSSARREESGEGADGAGREPGVEQGVDVYRRGFTDGEAVLVVNTGTAPVTVDVPAPAPVGSSADTLGIHGPAADIRIDGIAVDPASTSLTIPSWAAALVRRGSRWDR